MKTLELRKKSELELSRLIQQRRERIAEFSRQSTVTEVKNIRELRSMRKDIARALTILSEKRATASKETS